MSQFDAAKLRSPAWVAMPDDDDDEAVQVKAEISSINATVWWFGTTCVMLAAMLLVAETIAAPWWLVAVTAAEAYASLRRVILKYSKEQKQPAAAPKRPPTRLRHFTSLRLAQGAPVDELVARFLALDAMPDVRTVELGSNTSTERNAREHTIALLVTFAGHPQRQRFLRSKERAEFLDFAAPFIDDEFVADWESGALM